MRTTRRKSRILSEVHETVIGLNRLGLVSPKEMRMFDSLCQVDVPGMSPQKIKMLRKKENLSQAALASILNTSVSTVQKWESGDKRPSGPSLKLLDIIVRKGLAVVL